MKNNITKITTELTSHHYLLAVASIHVGALVHDTMLEVLESNPAVVSATPGPSGAAANHPMPAPGKDRGHIASVVDWRLVAYP